MTREWKLFVRDIYDAMQCIKEFVGTMKRREFLADEKTRSAVAFKIENIGEAQWGPHSRRIPAVDVGPQVEDCGSQMGMS